MSLFPIRLAPGGTITIHLRLAVKFPLWIHRRDFLILPDGDRVLTHERTLPFFPPPPKDEVKFKTQEETRQFVSGAPLLMAARYLQNEFEDASAFVEMLEGLRDATHHYYTYTLPKDATLGRYRFELQDFCEGKIWRSLTENSDYFLVEHLTLEKVTKTANGYDAHIKNESPEPVVAQICEVDPKLGADRGADHKLVTIAPKGITKVSFIHAALLLYRDGDECIRLGETKDPFCLRNPTMRYFWKLGKCYVFSTTSLNDAAFELDEEQGRIWSMADGFASRSFIRDDLKAAIYDQMIDAKLIQEIL